MLGYQITDAMPLGEGNAIFNYAFDPFQAGWGAAGNIGNQLGSAAWGVNLLNSQNKNAYRDALAAPAYAYQTAVDTQKLKNDALATLMQAFSGMASFGGLGGIQSNFGQGVTAGSGAKPTNTARFSGRAAYSPQQQNPLAQMLQQY